MWVTYFKFDHASGRLFFHVFASTSQLSAHCHFRLTCSFLRNHWLSFTNVFRCHGSFASPFFIFSSSCLHSLSILLWRPLWLCVCLQAVYRLRMTWGNYSTLLLPEQFSCVLVVSSVLEMKETWKDALGVWDQLEAETCVCVSVWVCVYLDEIQISLLSSFRFLFLHVYSISPPVSLILSLSEPLFLLSAAVLLHLVFSSHNQLWAFLLSLL